MPKTGCATSVPTQFTTLDRSVDRADYQKPQHITLCSPANFQFFQWLKFRPVLTFTHGLRILCPSLRARANSLYRDSRCSHIKKNLPISSHTTVCTNLVKPRALDSSAPPRQCTILPNAETTECCKFDCLCFGEFFPLAVALGWFFWGGLLSTTRSCRLYMHTTKNTILQPACLLSSLLVSHFPFLSAY